MNRHNKPFAVFALAKCSNGYAATTRAIDKGEGGKIGLPGGKVDSGETALRAVIRESLEEGFLLVGNGKFLHSGIVEGKIVHWYLFDGAILLSEYKEKGRITPIVVSLNQIINSGYGNEFLANINLNNI